MIAYRFDVEIVNRFVRYQNSSVLRRQFYAFNVIQHVINLHEIPVDISRMIVGWLVL